MLEEFSRPHARPRTVKGHHTAFFVLPGEMHPLSHFKLLTEGRLMRLPKHLDATVQGNASTYHAYNLKILICPIDAYSILSSACSDSTARVTSSALCSPGFSRPIGFTCVLAHRLRSSSYPPVSASNPRGLTHYWGSTGFPRSGFSFVN